MPRNFRRSLPCLVIRCQEQIMAIDRPHPATATPPGDDTRIPKVLSVDYLEDDKGKLRQVRVIQADDVEMVLVDDEPDEDLTDEKHEHVARFLDKRKGKGPS